MVRLSKWAINWGVRVGSASAGIALSPSLCLDLNPLRRVLPPPPPRRLDEFLLWMLSNGYLDA